MKTIRWQTVARILAKALNCELGMTGRPCGTCVNCQEIAQGNSVDVTEIDGASNRGIDEIRELRENVKFAPASCRYKIYIIDEVHMLSTAAFNALLKTLEEPPPHVIFMMATTELQKIPDTIVSRSQVFEFKTISSRLIGEQLTKIAKADGIDASPEAIALVARSAEGSMRDAETAFDQVIAFAGTTITVEDVAKLFRGVRLMEENELRNPVVAVRLNLAKSGRPALPLPGICRASPR